MKRLQSRESEWEQWKAMEPIVKAVPRYSAVSSLAEPSHS